MVSLYPTDELKARLDKLIQQEPGFGQCWVEIYHNEENRLQISLCSQINLPDTASDEEILDALKELVA